MNPSANVLILISFFFLSFTTNLNSVDAEPLTQSNFDEKVMKSKDIWFIMFGVPKCGAVKALNPEWEKVSKKLEGKVKFGEVDCQANYDLYVKYKIQGFPTIIVFAADKGKGAFVYTGERTAKGIEEAALLKLEGKGY